MELEKGGLRFPFSTLRTKGDKVLGKRRNRQRHGARDCSYGCCRGLVTGEKSKTNRIIRAREKRAWRKDNNE